MFPDIDRSSFWGPDMVDPIESILIPYEYSDSPLPSVFVVDLPELA